VTFLKCDAIIEERFRAAGSRPFAYAKKGDTVTMSYWRLPEDALDDEEALKEWAGLAWQAALRAGEPRRGSRPPGQPRSRKNNARQD